LELVPAHANIATLGENPDMVNGVLNLYVLLPSNSGVYVVCVCLRDAHFLHYPSTHDAPRVYMCCMCGVSLRSA
jgi:hypothetical protein